jgi:hypothetical protein
MATKQFVGAEESVEDRRQSPPFKPDAQALGKS